MTERAIVQELLAAREAVHELTHRNRQLEKGLASMALESLAKDEFVRNLQEEIEKLHGYNARLASRNARLERAEWERA